MYVPWHLDFFGGKENMCFVTRSNWFIIVWYCFGIVEMSRLGSSELNRDPDKEGPLHNEIQIVGEVIVFTLIGNLYI